MINFQQQDSTISHKFIDKLVNHESLKEQVLSKTNHEAISTFAKSINASALAFESGMLVVDEYTCENEKGRIDKIMNFAAEEGIEVAAIRSLPSQDLAEYEQKFTIDVSKLNEPSQAESQKMFDSIIEKGYRMGAQDIHMTLSNENNTAFVKYKVDNLWSDKVDDLKDYAFGKAIASSAFDSRQGVGQSSGSFDESTTPQETDIEHTIYDKSIAVDKLSIRYSKSKTAKVGELLVAMRLISHKNVKDLHELELPIEVEHKIRQQLKRGKGAIITSGPTGSGKSTTLFAALLAYPSNKSIQTFEDPIEIRVPHQKHHIVQNTIDKVLGYKNQLSAILRQAPDGIYITETRDKGTADFVFHVAKSGHFVMTSTHANNAAGIVPRLQDYGISTFDLATEGAVELLLSQRLVRKLCPKCSLSPADYEQKYPTKIKDEAFELSEELRSLNIIKRINHDGCSACVKGESGRKLIIEMIDVGPKDRAFISNNDLAGWHSYLEKSDMITIKDRLIQAVEAGTIDITRAAEHIS